MKNSTFKKALVCLLICLISFMQKGTCTNIPKLAKSKKLIVIIPDEDSKAYNNIMDAVQDHWKFGEYKFMKIKDAEQLYGNSDYLFLALVVQTMQPKTTSGDFNLTLRRGKFFSNKDFNKLAPVYAAPLFNNYGVYYGSMDNMPPLLEKQLYF